VSLCAFSCAASSIVAGAAKQKVPPLPPSVSAYLTVDGVVAIAAVDDIVTSGDQIAIQVDETAPSGICRMCPSAE
jgi:hypothetical protein